MLTFYQCTLYHEVRKEVYYTSSKTEEEAEITEVT